MFSFRTKIAVGLVASFALAVAGIAMGGSLTPPAGIVAPTMETLNNIYAALASNSFDSSAVTANASGPLLGQLRYISQNLAWASGSSNIWNLNSGNVGIGTSTPTTKLDVVGAASVSGVFGPGADNTYNLGSTTNRWKSLYLSPGSLHISSTTGTSGAGASYTDASLAFGSGSSLSLTALPIGGGSSGSMEFRVGTGTSVGQGVVGAQYKGVYLSASGNVGIGTNSPDANLVVYDRLVANQQAIIKVTGDPVAGSRFNAAVVIQRGAGEKDVAGVVIGHAAQTSLSSSDYFLGEQYQGGSVDRNFYIARTGYTSFNNGTPFLTILYSNGKIGVNNTSPTTAFDIKGSSTFDPFRVASVSGDSLLYVTKSGNVGIGTTIPSTRFMVVGAASASQYFGANLTNCALAGNKLLWSDGVFSCGADQIGAGGGALIGIRQSDGVFTNRSSISFDAAHFAVSFPDEALVRLNWGAGGPASLSQAETVTGAWTFGAANTGLTISNNASVSGTLEVGLLKGTIASLSQNLDPSLNATYSLGETLTRWKDLYLASASLHIGTNGNEAVISYETSGTQGISFKPNGTTTSVLFTDGGNVGIGSASAVAQVDVYADTPTLRLRSTNAADGMAAISLVPTTAGVAQTPWELIVNESGGSDFSIMRGGSRALYIDTSRRIALGEGGTQLVSAVVTIASGSAPGATSSNLSLYSQSSVSMTFNGNSDVAQNRFTLSAGGVGGAGERFSILNGAGTEIFKLASSGTLALSGYTAGSVLFQGTSAVAQDNTNFFWDNTSKRLGIGTNSPSKALDVGATGGVQVGTGGVTVADGGNVIVTGTANYVAIGGQPFLRAPGNIGAVQNAAVGVGAGGVVTSGGNNVFLGYHAGFSLTIGDSNVLVGMDAGSVATSSNWNTFVGMRSGWKNRIGDENTGLGTMSLSENTYGTRNTALGYGALQNNTTGDSNTAAGKWSMRDNTTGTNNAAYGRYSLISNTTGGQNTSLGNFSLQTATTAEATTAVGNSALLNIPGGIANTALGYSAGLNASGSYNTLLGVFTDARPGVDQAIVMGAYASATADNQWVVGAGAYPITEAFFGQGVSTSSPGAFRINATSGGGADNAGAILRIAAGRSTGAATGGNIEFQTSDAPGGDGPAELLQPLSTKMRILSGGNVGIATANVDAKFEVAGTASVSKVLTDLTASTNNFALCHENNGAGTAEEIKDCTGAPSADYMEMYPMDPSVEEGEIVIPSKTAWVTTTRGNRVPVLIRATADDRSLILGISSIASDAGDFNSIGYNIRPEDNPQPLALKGRVLLKVNLENGPIAVGDPITISSIPGIGTRATTSGQIVGTALEPLDTLASGSFQKIMVFVGPQYWGTDTSGGTPVVAAGGTAAPELSQIVASVLTWLRDSLNIVFEQGMIKTIRGVFETADVQKGITTYDEVTGDPYCMRVRNGQVVAVPGSCDVLAPPPPVGRSNESAATPMGNPTPTPNVSVEASPSPTMTPDVTPTATPDVTPAPSAAPTPDTTPAPVETPPAI